jgi:hypothetical protein
VSADSPLPRYVFADVWHVDVPSHVAYDVLADLASYPTWWRQVRSVERIDDDSARVVCRSLLPYTLRFDMFRVVEDRAAGVLEARLAGDLDGWARWTVRADRSRGGAALHFEQQVTTPSPLLRRLATIGRPSLERNHDWMMWSGQRGLQRRLGGACAQPA